MQNFKFLNINALLLSTGNLVLIALIYVGLVKLRIFNLLPTEYNIVHWDAVFYREIRDFGYTFKPLRPSNMAFFPLFPYIWKMTHFSAIEMSIFNLILFIFSLSLLINTQKYSNVYLLTLVSFPCFIFFFMPYSESIFFFFGTLVILGYKEDRNWLLVIGILGCCLTRAVSTVFIPLLIVTELLFWTRIKSKSHENLLVYCLTAVFAILIIVIIQGIETDKWFYYLEAAKNFNRHWELPSIPFTTISPEKILGTDSVAWMIGAIAVYFGSKSAIMFLRDFIRKANHQPFADKAVIFSVLFLSSVFIIDTFFTNKLGGQTNIWSINRHLLCNPFAFCFINWFYWECKERRFDLCFILIILTTGLFVTGVFQYRIHACFYILVSLSFILSKFIKQAHLFLYPLYAFNLVLFVIFYQDYLSYRWVG